MFGRTKPGDHHGRHRLEDRFTRAAQDAPATDVAPRDARETEDFRPVFVTSPPEAR
jgi:hypothetical protein